MFELIFSNLSQLITASTKSDFFRKSLTVAAEEAYDTNSKIF